MLPSAVNHQLSAVPMSLSTIKKYRYQEPLSSKVPIVFEISSIHLDKSCVANHNRRCENFMIFLVEEGSGHYSIDFNEFEINGAGVFCLSPGQVLEVMAESMKSGYEISFNKEFYCVETHGKEIACNGVIFNNIHKATFLQLEPNEVPFFRMLLDNMIKELQNPGKAHRDLLETYLRMFLIEVLRKQDERAPLVTKTNGDVSENRLVGDFIALVDKHFRKKHAVSDYAELLYVSPKSLAKRLNANGYKTPTEVIRDRIVLEAKRDLRYTKKTVKEIAFGLGFDDPAYFTRYFKKAENESPMVYRATYGSN